MYLKVIGIEKREGTIKDNNFHWINYDVYCSYPPQSNDNIKGVKVKTFLIKNKEIGNLEPFNWLGKEVEFSYDDEKNLQNVYVK